MEPSKDPENRAMLYGACTKPLPFPGAIRKLGCHANISLDDAEHDLRARYGTCYGPGLRLRIIPVRQPKQAAERRLMRLLAPYHFDGELYACADADELDAAIDAAFQQLETEFDNAHRTKLSKGKLARINKDRAAQEELQRQRQARQAEEHRLAVEKARIRTEKASKALAALEQQDTAPTTTTELDATRDEAVTAWIAAHVIRDTSEHAHVRMSALAIEFRKTITAVQWRRVGSLRFKDKAVAYMSEGEPFPRPIISLVSRPAMSRIAFSILSSFLSICWSFSDTARNLTSVSFSRLLTRCPTYTEVPPAQTAPRPNIGGQLTFIPNFSLRSDCILNILSRPTSLFDCTFAPFSVSCLLQLAFFFTQPERASDHHNGTRQLEACVPCIQPRQLVSASTYRAPLNRGAATHCRAGPWLPRPAPGTARS